MSNELDYNTLVKRGCFFPFKKKDDPTPLPCGKCPYCIQKRINGWIFRLQEHAKDADSVVFLTLTYNNEHVPISTNGFMTLQKTDVQKFLKRLRKLSGQGNHTPVEKRIKYYFVGEYGTKTHRPHYHAIIFNCDKKQIETAWKLDGVEIGDVWLGTVTTNSIAYTLKYINKFKHKKRHERDDRHAEFAIISKGIGKRYVQRSENVRLHKSDLTRLYIQKQDGHKIALPRYYKDKIYTDEEKVQIQGICEDLFKDDGYQLDRKEDARLLEYKREKVRLMRKRAHGNKI